MNNPLTDAVPLDDDELLDDGASTTNAPRAEGAQPGAASDEDAAAGVADGDGAAAGADDVDAEALRAVAGDPDVDDDDDDAEGGKGQRIPKSRFDEVNEARKNAQAESAQLRQLLMQVVGNGAGTTTATTPTPKPRDFEAEYEALADQYDKGTIDEAKFRRDERKLNIEQAKAEMAAEYEPKLRALEQQRALEAQQAQNEAWTKEVNEAIKAYPFLNHKGSDANKEAIVAVRTECEELMQAGIPAAKALRLAVRDVAPQYGKAAAPTPDDVAAARQRKAREAAAAAENRQPPALGGAGNGVRVQGKQRLTASVADHDKWEDVPEEQRDGAFIA